MKYALYEKATGKIVNIILLEEGAAWAPPEMHGVVSAEGVRVEIGDTWDGIRFIPFVETAARAAAAAQAAADDAVIKDVLLEQGRQTLANWDSLFFTSSQKFAVVKALLTYVLRKEGR